MDWKLGFVGSGVMAEVMLRGLLDEQVLPADRIYASDRNPERVEELSERYGVHGTGDNVRVATEADVLVIALKPQTVSRALKELRGKVKKEAPVLSIVAGATVSAIRKGLSHQKVIRCMPNLPCRIRKGMTVWTAPPDLDESDLEKVQEILGVMGGELRVDDESHIDRATAVNGTGPAIMAEFVKGLLEAATFIGEPRSVAQETVLATLAGTTEMIRKSAEEGKHIAEIIDEVTSPGGTTSRALQELKRGSFTACLTDAVSAAHTRTLELGRALEKQIDE